MVQVDWIHKGHSVNLVWASAGLLDTHRPGMRETAAFRYNVLVDAKAQREFNTTAVDTRRQTGAREQEAAVAAGHALVRITVASSLTVPAEWNLEDHAARLENDSSGRFRLLRLELAQDSAFVAAALPVGIGLPRLTRAFDS